MSEINPIILGQVKTTPAKNISFSGSNELNLVNIQTAKEIGEIAKREIGTMPFRVASAGYSAPPEGYEADTKAFLKFLDSELGTRSTAFVTSPTVDPGSIDAITTEVTGLNNGKIFYVTAQDYVEYINPNNTPNSIDSTVYKKAPKYVLPDPSEYSKATAEASNIFVSTGGRNATVSDFVNAIKHGNKAIVFDNPKLEVPAWGDKKGRVENASKYLNDQIGAFMKGEPLPHPMVCDFTMEFLDKNKDKLKNLVCVVSPDKNDPNGIFKAAKQAANFIK